MDPILPIIFFLVVASAVALLAAKRFIIDNSDFWFSMGMILADFGKYKRAARCCERAVRIYPFYVHAWNRLSASTLQSVVFFTILPQQSNNPNNIIIQIRYLKMRFTINPNCNFSYPHEQKCYPLERWLLCGLL